jgi:tRNA modification GTPase
MKALETFREGDTIAAISTPYGIGGIGIVRISGAHAERVAWNLFQPKRPLKHFTSHRLYYGHIVDPLKGTIIDEVLLTVMRAPHSYTREDVVEIQCHGGYISVQRILELVLTHEVRLAQPGEFTQRAFVNGRIDLTQAEAVVDVIEAKTQAAYRFAQRQMAGVLYQEIKRIQETLKDLLVEIEASLDFPEEDLQDLDLNAILNQLEQCLRDTRPLEATYKEGHLYRDGVTIVIGGRPNVGKSTLMNVLLGQDRVLVSPTPGTTRDFIEGQCSLGGIPVRLVDTAGLREVEEELESLGVETARKQIAGADLFLLLLDAATMETESLKELLTLFPDSERTVLVINKMDLVDSDILDRQGALLRPLSPVNISALYRQGIEALKEKILSLLIKDHTDLDSRAVITNARHHSAVKECINALEQARAQLNEEEPVPELLAADLRAALRSMGEIVGETTTQEILDSIFATFCIGK